MKTFTELSRNGIILLILAIVMAVSTNSCQKDEVPAEIDEEQNVILKDADISVADIDAVIGKIKAYAEDGKLEPGLANSLVSKLENAKKSLEKGNEVAAYNQLQAVINQLKDLVSQGTIEAWLGEELITDVKVATGEEWVCHLNVGDDYQGGVIAYILKPGDPGYEEGVCHGIIAAPYDQGGAPWGCADTPISGAWNNGIGGGIYNTQAIVNQCTQAGIAARICYNLVLGDYDDWWLPSTVELSLLYENRVLIGNFSDAIYWSSSEFESIYAWYYHFKTDVYNGWDTKEKVYQVRAIRYF